MSAAQDEEIRRLQNAAADQKLALSRRLDGLRTQIRQAQGALEQADDRMEKLNAQKRLTALQRELKQGEQNLFLEQMRLDVECERQSEALRAVDRLAVKVLREFVVEMEAV